MSERLNLLINLVLAILGAFLAGHFLSPIFKIETLSEAITVLTLLSTVLGALILFIIITLFRVNWPRPA